MTGNNLVKIRQVLISVSVPLETLSTNSNNDNINNNNNNNNNNDNEKNNDFFFSILMIVHIPQRDKYNRQMLFCQHLGVTKNYT